MKKETIIIEIDGDGSIGADHKSGADASCLDSLDALLKGLGTETKRDVRTEAHRKASAVTQIRGKS
jgi:hypothetical protein